MPTYEVDVAGETYEVESARDLTDDEVVAALSVNGVKVPSPAPAEEEELGFVSRYGPTAIRAIGGTVAGVVGAVPTPITTPAAALIGGGTETLAQAAEIATGEREELAPLEIGAEAALSAVPLGRFAKAGFGIGRAAVRGAARVGAVEAVGTQVRSLAREGELASVEETATGAALGAVFGAAGGAVEARFARPAARAGGAVEESAARAVPDADPLPPLGRRQVALPEEVAAATPDPQLRLFDDGGKIDEAASSVLEERPTVEVQRALADEVTSRADEAARALADLSPDVREQRFFRQLSATIKEGLFDPTETGRLLRRGGMTVDDFFKKEVVPMFTEFERDISEAGKKLNTVSREKAAIVAAMRRDPELRKLVDGHAIAKQEAEGDGALWRLWREALDLDDASRVLVIGQMATAHRNFVSQLGRLVLEVPTDVVKRVLPSRLGGVRGNPLATLYGIATASKPGDTTRVLDLLERVGPEGELFARKLFGRATSESLLGAGARPVRGLPARMAETFRSGLRERRVMKTIFGPVADAAGAYNQLSENFGRRAAFQARLMQRAKARGLAWADVVENPSKLATDDYDDALRHALEVTFSADPTSKMGKQFVNFVRSLGPIGSTFVTFPRYMVNAGKFLLDFNPAGALRLLDETKLAKRGGEIASRAVIGTGMLGAAYLFRASKYAGERWYEGRSADGTRTNLLGLAGPTIPYLAMGEMMYRAIHGEEGRPPFTPEDLLQGSVGIRLSPGAQAALEAIGARDAKGWEAWYRAAERSVGEFVGRFTVPLRTVKDFAAAYGNDSEAIYYDPREVAELGGVRTTVGSPTVQNVPELGAALGRPAAVSPLTGREKRGEFTAVRQLTGVTRFTKTKLEAEFARLGLTDYDTFQRTGFPKADRELARRVGLLADRLAPTVLDSPTYNGVPDSAKRLVWDELFKEIGGEAREHLAATNPELAEVVRTSRQVPRREREALRDLGTDVDELLFQAAKAAPENTFVSPGVRVPERAAPPTETPTTRGPTTTTLKGRIAAVESAGTEDPYRALGPVIRDRRSAHFGSRAYGKYQVMASNIGPWAEEAGYSGMTPAEFLDDSEAQEVIVEVQLAKKRRAGWSDPEILSWWHSGRREPGEARDLGTGLTTREYVSRAMEAR